MHSEWLNGALVYLAAAVLAVPLARSLGLGSIIGYLAAGILIGPWGLKFVTRPEDMLQFAEFGVVLMLFLVGLELDPQRLWALRKPIFGWGSVQLFGSALLLALAGLAFGVDWRISLVAALGLAMSSTAIGLGVLAERNVMSTTAGESILSVALLQDIAAIPILALLPLLAVATAGQEAGGGWLGAAKAIGTIAAIILGGRLLLRPALRWIANSDSPEIFTAASLLLVVATAALMNAVGLSMALGAFLAGVLLAESEYRRELETDIEPFKGLLLGLFFIAVGMNIDFAVVLAEPLLIAATVVGFLLLKAAALWAMARTMPIPKPERPLFIILLAQGGEFGFVVFQTATQAGVVSAPVSSFLIASVAISMLLTPLVLVAADRWWVPLLGDDKDLRLEELKEPQHEPVVIAGFGRYGQIVGRMLFANGIRPTVLDASRPDAHRRCRQGARDRRRDRRHRAEHRLREDGRRQLSARRHRRPRPQRPALLRALRARRAADRARDARLGIDERAQHARSTRLAAAPRAKARAPLSPPQRQAAGRDRAAPQGRGTPDRRRQAGPAAARGAVRARAPAGSRAAGARRLERAGRVALAARRPRARRSLVSFA
jgi:glutathione-regulated potassium-efflux system ancillary protein KefC